MKVDFNTNIRTKYMVSAIRNAEYVPYFDTIPKEPIGKKATTDKVDSQTINDSYEMNIYKLYPAKHSNGTINPWYWGRIKHNKKDAFVALADSSESSHDAIVKYTNKKENTSYFGPWVSTWDEINFSIPSVEKDEEEYFTPSSSKLSTLSGDLLRVEDLATMNSSLSSSFEDSVLYLKDLVLSDIESDVDVDDDRITMVMSDSDTESIY